jgi:hypothetical protein
MPITSMIGPDGAVCQRVLKDAKALLDELG